MSDPIIRLYYRESDGSLTDSEENYELATFSGVMPCIGDRFLSPWVPGGKPRNEPEFRDILTVVERIFNPKDQDDYIMLVCEVRQGTEMDRPLMPQASKIS